MTMSTVRRDAAAGGLLASIALLAAAAVTQPSLGSGAAEKLAAIDGAGTSGALSAAAFTAAQLPFLAGLLGIGHLLRDRAPRLGTIGAALGVVGAFGHSVFGGVTLTYLFMADDATHRAAYTTLVSDIEGSPVMLFALLGLVGTVLGLLLVSIALFRSEVGPRWVGPALWAFLATEFVGGAVSDHASYVSSAIGVAAFVALARVVRAEWDLSPAPASPSAVLAAPAR